MISGAPHNCRNCRHWKSVGLTINNVKVGECRSGPPTAVMQMIQTIASPQPTPVPIGQWPLVGEGDECGRFQQVPIVTSPNETSR